MNSHRDPNLLSLVRAFVVAGMLASCPLTGCAPEGLETIEVGDREDVAREIVKPDLPAPPRSRKAGGLRSNEARPEPAVDTVTGVSPSP